MGRLLIVVVLAGCGRMHFDAIEGSSGATDGSTGDVAQDLLLAWYKLDDDSTDGVLDSTGNGHTGTCLGCPIPTPDGKFDGAYIFAGTAVAIPDSASLRPAELTVTVWAKSAVTSTQQLVGKPFGTQLANSWQLYLDMGGGYGACSAAQCLTPSAVVSLDVWHHFAYVSSGTIHATYLDGARVTGGPNTLAYDANDILLGADRDNGTNWAFLSGSLDDVRIYGRALDDAEIAALAAE